MSRIFEALKRVETAYSPLKITPNEAAASNGVSVDGASVGTVSAETARRVKALNEVPSKPVENAETRSVSPKASSESRLVALTDPDGLGAEKFRALVTRLDNMGRQRQLKSFQVTSSVVHEGKTVVAGNIAVTFANYCDSKTLLVEGDLHRPGLAALFGFQELRGVSEWWSGKDSELTQFIHKVKGMPLWFLPAGEICDRPSDILRSMRFVKAFTQLTSQFEWIVVDSTPMLPIVDANLWSKLLDGTLLVVREGITPVNALKNGLQALDQPKLIGVVLNDAVGTDEVDYYGEYCGSRKAAARPFDTKR